MAKSSLTLPFLLAAISTAVAGTEERHLGPHVHGQATVNVAVEGNALEVELSLPGHDAIGFEHPPGNASEKATLDRAGAALRAGGWLKPSPAAACTLGSAKVEPHGFGGASEPGGHADFDASYRFTCANADRLDGLDVGLTDAFPSVHKVVVGIITSEGSTEQTLEGTMHEVALRP
jgi:hypothetical protein